MGWLEKWGLKLISTQVVVEVEVGVELGNIPILLISDCLKSCYHCMSRWGFDKIQLAATRHVTCAKDSDWLAKRPVMHLHMPVQWIHDNYSSSR